MAVQLTQRMKNWIEKLGVHIALADKNAYPTVIVVDSCEVNGAEIRLPLSEAQYAQAAACLSENPHTALAPGKLGGVRVPFQFKGKAVLEEGAIVFTTEQIYCTKPGYEAGTRLDVMPFEKMKEFDESRWTDLVPPGF